MKAAILEKLGSPLVVRDIAHYDRIYRKLIAAVPDLADVSSSFSMEKLKATTALPRPA